MCKCTPELRTPFCGKVGCEWPMKEKKSAKHKLSRDQRFTSLVRAVRAEGYVITCDEKGHVSLTRPKTVGCPKCKDGGWVCENHPNEVAHECRRCGGAGMPCTCGEGQRVKGAEPDIWPICGPVGHPVSCGKCERCELEARAIEEAWARGEQPFWKNTVKE